MRNVRMTISRQIALMAMMKGVEILGLEGDCVVVAAVVDAPAAVVGNSVVYTVHLIEI